MAIEISSPKDFRRVPMDLEQRKAVLIGLSVIQKRIAEIHQAPNLDENREASYRDLLNQAVHLHELGSEGYIQDPQSSASFVKVMDNLIVDISKRSADISGKIPSNVSVLKQNLEILIQVLKRSIRTEGLFRISGLASKINTTDMSKKLRDIKCDEHTAAGMLKKLLREMPERLLEPVQELLLSVNPNDLLQSEKTKRILAELPGQNRELLQILFSFLREVEAEKDYNKMTIENLATCFAPNLVRQTESFDEIQDTARYIAAVAALIRNQDRLLG